MTRLTRGSIPSFRVPPPNIDTQHPDDNEHSTLLSRGLISPTKSPSASPSPSPKKKKLRAEQRNIAMASSSNPTPLL
jgi:vesicle-associated membrane protein 7